MGSASQLAQPEIADIVDVLVMNDASSDNTNWLAKEYGCAVVTHVFNLGYGSGLQLGYKYAIRRGYSYVIQMDADGQHDVCNIPKIYQRLKEKDDDGRTPDIVLGSRFMKGSTEFEVSFAKKMAFVLFRKMLYLATGRKIADPTTGLQGLSRKAVLYYSKYNHFDDKYPDTNMITQMLLLDFKVVEIPAVMPARTSGKSMHSGLKPIWYMMRMFYSVLAVIFRCKVLKMDAGAGRIDVESNYGGGYVGYVAGKGKKHTFNLAESFAREKSGGKKVTYTNPIAVAKNGGWRYQYGNQFYVELVNQYLTVPQVSGELAQKVMNEALKYQGWKYVYGGSNPNTSFDCSGLTQWCYGKAGISLPRTAQAQYDATQHLPLSQAKAGDLVFFHSTYNAGTYVTHVAIYVGNNKIYHAGDPIGYADLSSSYWQQHLIGAGRVKQ